MSLTRRTTLSRSSPMRRTAARPRTTRAAKPARRARATGPDVDARAVVWARAGGCCEFCGRNVTGTSTSDHSIHHRHPRRMGGTRRPWINLPSNLLLLCGSGTAGCHGRVEQHRTTSYESGWLVREGQTPAQVPVLLTDPTTPATTRLVWLTHDGAYTTHPPMEDQ